nr:FkbM family methyltransferase [Brucella anthropi]
MINFKFWKKQEKIDTGSSKIELPTDFDSETYLRLHPDVADANVDPKEHYLWYGKDEGRRYKPQRKVYIDIGANHGKTIEAFTSENPEFEIFAFEPAPQLATELREKFQHNANITIFEAAAWISDGTVTFYPGAISDESSTLLTGKSDDSPWKIDYENGLEVRAVDIASWTMNNTSDDDLVIMKMDAEGSEYKLIPRLIDLNVPARLNEIRVEWHWDRYPDEVTETQHHKIRDELKSLVTLVDWH